MFDHTFPPHYIFNHLPVGIFRSDLLKLKMKKVLLLVYLYTLGWETCLTSQVETFMNFPAKLRRIGVIDITAHFESYFVKYLIKFLPKK